LGVLGWSTEKGKLDKSAFREITLSLWERAG